MSQKKVDAYKESKADRNRNSRKEVRRRRLEIGILIAVIAAGIIWFAIAGITRSINSSTETITLQTEAIDNYLGDLQG